MSASNVFISICIPAYKRPENIDRLLHSIRQQKHGNFEVVVTDDSPDESVRSTIQKYGDLPIRYYKNQHALGTPANWNRSIALAKGEWIKIMHDDDWFCNKESLRLFAERTSTKKAFIFSRYKNVFENGAEEMPAFPSSWKSKIIRQPVILLAQNVIGPPSVTMVHSSIKERYDELMKWRVDLDYYIRVLRNEKSYEMIEEPLINVGISSSQVTNYCINLPEVELPEGLLLLTKYGVTPLRHLLVYDAWWRILRNTGIRSEKQLMDFTPGGKWPEVITHMLAHQSNLPRRLLENGVVSKMAMMFSYLQNQKYLRG